MDLTTYEVTGRPEIGAGAWLELIGPAQSPDDAAHEVLTSLGRRFARTYRSA